LFIDYYLLPKCSKFTVAGAEWKVHREGRDEKLQTFWSHKLEAVAIWFEEFSAGGASAFAASLINPESTGKDYYLGGPEDVR
jgi:hypothetical protein